MIHWNSKRFSWKKLKIYNFFEIDIQVLAHLRFEGEIYNYGNLVKIEKRTTSDESRSRGCGRDLKGTKVSRNF